MSERLRRQLAARLARPRRLFVTPGGDELDAWCREHPGTAVELIVSARALHELVVEPGLPLPDLDAVQAYAQQQFAHYFGAAAQRFAVAPWRVAGRSGASALHGLDLAALQARASAAQVRLVRVRPAWSAWLASLPASVRAATGRLVWHEGSDGDVTVVVIEVEQGRVGALQLRRLHRLGDLGGATPLALGSPADSLAPQPGPAVPQPDFLPRGTRSPLAWPLAVTGALVLATAGWSALESRRALEVAQAARDRVAQLRAAAPATPRPAARSRSEPAENRSAAEARALLGMPWEPLLSRVETAGAEARPIAWLGLDAKAGRGELRLEGLTPDRLLALQLAEQLGTTPGWSQVVLSRFSTAETGLVGQRFEIVARVPAGGGS
ncbi:hypothetical protein [Roseateles puraquae]|uniref:Uncharacterized protein n=1 Tax=Roseateles puraquae TaxID=431059 RepID=A0A254NDI1_9BURK|nr:hypothetical protein [Roseateles puraquae]MDG0854996.1 hypothetical protein [Roseateles puraquae]OWR04437.1 hypothetical protein CDO81_07565 [Roseateles puraquae]